MVDYKRLMSLANDMRAFSHVPYSNFRVGAVLVGKSGKEYTGCNVENAAFSPTICAERTFECIAIVGGRSGETSPLCAPCGVCRQVMAEFCDDDFKVILGTPDDFKVYTLKEMLPLTFTSKEL